jgi:hypothetical protein
LSFFSSLRREQPQLSNVSTELGCLVDPRMGDAVELKVKRKRKMIPALGVAWKDGSGRLLTHSTVLKCAIASGVRDPDRLSYRRKSAGEIARWPSSSRSSTSVGERGAECEQEEN